MVNWIEKYFQWANAWTIASDLGTVILLGGFAAWVWSRFSNSLPLFLRLPNPKAKKIVILTIEPTSAKRLTDTLELSGLFNPKNIKVHSPQHPSDFKYADLFVVDWAAIQAHTPAAAAGAPV
jgi:hypothetical protein